jgi:hypothetical protein
MPEKTTHGRTKAGVEIIYDVLDRMAEEAARHIAAPTSTWSTEHGTGPAETFPVRLDPELRAALGAEQDETTASEVIRAALRRYLQAG